MPWLDEFGYMDCPWCKTRNIAMHPIVTNQTITLADGSNRQWNLVSCPRCGGVVVIETRINFQEKLRTVPDELAMDTVKHLPPAIEERFKGAHRALDAGLWSAAVVELRRTLEGALHEQGIEVRNLANGIQQLVASGLVTPAFSELLQVVRLVGNQGAHFSDDDVSEESARRATSFTTQILRNLFEVPGELSLLREPEEAPADEDEPSTVSAA